MQQGLYYLCALMLGGGPNGREKGLYATFCARRDQLAATVAKPEQAISSGRPMETILSLTEAQVAKVAGLAKLKLDDSQVSEYASELSRILDLVETLESSDTDNVPPMAHPLDLAARLRADEVSEPNQRTEFQAIAPRVEDGVYLVPRVIE